MVSYLFCSFWEQDSLHMSTEPIILNRSQVLRRGREGRKHKPCSLCWTNSVYPQILATPWFRLLHDMFVSSFLRTGRLAKGASDIAITGLDKTTKVIDVIPDFTFYSSSFQVLVLALRDQCSSCYYTL